MKRHNHLWADVTSFPALLAAAKKAMRRKRRQGNVCRFAFNLERELFRMQDELVTRTWKPGEFHTFQIVQPKPRLISASPFRDRVVHHALCHVLARVFEPTFIHDNYANRVGKGTHAAVQRYQQLARNNTHVLQCDVARYFPSIDHALLKDIVAGKIKDTNVLWLVNLLIDHGNPPEPVVEWFPGDDLFTATERRRSLPLGNQTSQFLSNVYLNPFDHWAKETLKARHYLRYVDDFVILGNDPGWLSEARERIRDELVRWRLRLHPRKAVIARTQDSIRWLGYRIFPSHRLLPRDNVVKLQRRLKRWQKGYAAGTMSQEQIQRSLAGWLGHAVQADTWLLREWLFLDVRWQAANEGAAQEADPHRR